MVALLIVKYESVVLLQFELSKVLAFLIVICFIIFL